jgi:polysaccharide biosynthesis transport protein
MSFSQFVAALRARWILALGVFIAVVAVTAAVTMLLPARYKAYSSVVVDGKSPDPINGSIMANAMMSSYIATQTDIIQSDRVAKRVISLLNLDKVPVLRSQWIEETGGKGVYDSWLSQRLSKALSVVPSRDSSVITIEYSATDPAFAVAMANAFVKAYIETTVELRVEPAKRFGQMFDEQAKQARDRLETAQTRLSAYQREKGLIATDERFDVENARLAEISSQLVALQSLSAESNSRQARAGNNSSEVLNNPVVVGLTTELSRQEASLKQISAKLGPAHPQVQELTASNAELRDRIAKESTRVTSSVVINNAVNRSREDQIRTSLEAQRQRILKMKEQRDAAAVLYRDVEIAQRAYDSLRARLDLSSLESQSNQTNVSVLNEASQPSEPSSPRVALNIVASVFLGAMLGVGVAVLREIMDRRLRTEEDFTNLLSSNLLGVMPVARDTKSGKKALIGITFPRVAREATPKRLNAPQGV